ncbi:hypothetical protein [Legionella bononiensis]|uniref:Substrate of the Dot/Icm secretion system n=1 Tax=Legionella bononiensis TaxID=2793102 RepID=A0ABS1WA17_9GAMM|nr:hypothetical protein [Legionella bononiensis]MBL7480573.1 hypothetical protein [Legionella bononiensis]MBL7526188.1 hypothetical protein [Legionella bononiensis]MBL7563317.1 hypothetical protein [Legionella bononiensis]
MPVQRKKLESPKEERARAIENNPCNICRSMGLPICRGHGGGGGGGESESSSRDSQSDEEQKNHEMMSLSLKKPSSLENIFNSELWELTADSDFIYEFNDPYALLRITLNMELGSIVFEAKRELSKEDQDALNDLFDEIEKEFDSFKKSLDKSQIPLESMTLTREANKLTIKIPSPKFYDTFVQQLMDKNLLPTKTFPLPQPNKSVVTPELDPAVEALQKYTSLLPNPFDITNGPKFTGRD